MFEVNILLPNFIEDFLGLGLVPALKQAAVRSPDVFVVLRSGHANCPAES
jgi:hypothetical protein